MSDTNPTIQAKEAGLKPDHPIVRVWQPLRLVDQQPDGAPVYENDYYSVIVRKERLFGQTFYQLSIINADQSAHRDWREFQQIKNELCGEEAEGIELYPAESRKLDPSNMFLVYVFKNELPIKIGKFIRSVLSPEESIAPQRDFHA